MTWWAQFGLCVVALGLNFGLLIFELARWAH